MTKEKIASLNKYVQEHKAKLADAEKGVLSVKHKNSAKEYIAFLKNEIRLTTSKLEAAKLEAQAPK